MDKQRERTALVLEVQQGNAAAYDRLYELEYPWTYRVAQNLVGNATDAEDLAARAWILVWEKCRELRSPTAFRGWMKQIMTRLALEERRARARQTERGEPLHLLEECCDDLRDPARLDPVCAEALFRVTDLTVAYARLERALLEVRCDCSPSANVCYAEIVDCVARYGWVEPQALCAHLAEKLHLRRNAAAMRRLEIFKKAARRGLPLETILADAELTGAARPVFRKVAGQLADAA